VTPRRIMNEIHQNNIKKHFFKKWDKIVSIAVLSLLIIFFVFFSRMSPSFGIDVKTNNNVKNYLEISSFKIICFF